MKHDNPIFMEYDINSIEPWKVEGIDLDLTDIFMKAYDELYTDEDSDQEDIKNADYREKRNHESCN